MVQITEENRPKCVKCEDPAIMLVDRMWICGKCWHKYSEKQIEGRQKLFLES